jgi:hypothetical protein
LSFTCSLCGTEHDERLLDIRMGLPDAVFALSTAERERRASMGDDAAIFYDVDADELRYYVRGLIELPVAELDSGFRYGVWIEVDGEDYARIGQLWEDPDAAGERFEGRLANELEPYRDTLGLPVDLTLATVDRLPAVELRDGKNRLVDDQRRGIDLVRTHELAASVGGS